MSAPQPQAAAALAAQAAVLVVNAGSSTLKFALYPRSGDSAAEFAAHPSFASGQLDGLQPGGRLQLCAAGEAPVDLDAGQDEDDRFDVALQALQRHVATVAPQARIVAVAHRIVHGGGEFVAPIVLDDAALQRLARLAPLAPLHQPHNLAGVAALGRAFPGLAQVGCFDTAFHASLPDLETRFALPQVLHDEGIRRYGFHGLSYQYLMQVLPAFSARAGGRVLMAHLGSGASLCGAVGGRSVATTMGFSALDGLMMGSRSGALDPGVVLHLWRLGWTEAQVEKLLYKESGLLGVSGLGSDMRLLRRAAAAGSETAGRAIDLFVHRLRRESGALAAVLGGLDVLVCTGGIGEHDAATRAAMAEALHFLGVTIDPQANAAATGDTIRPIHAADSAVEVWVVPTDEGRVAAQAAWALLGTSAGDAAEPPG
ncbi:acetate/propionate family kinase [Sphaerotilus uruguayifluvii]|uniref:Acetate kinase n=1 Tax=Sphaerotilus uruguayifluvii TaxID=2735897 RepID=A0ABX2G2S8_9BURK|nr:acetate kinase [Leptothrix sp. C29]